MNRLRSSIQVSTRMAILAIWTCLALSVLAENFQAVRVITWNIEWFPGRSPQPTERAEAIHSKEVAAYIPTLEPDILILQEIRNLEAAHYLIDQLPDLKLNSISEFVRPDPTISQQIVIASRFMVIESDTKLFTGEAYDYGDKEPYRGFVFAAMQSPFGGTLLVYGVHLKSNWGDAEVNVPMRENAARQIVQHAIRKAQQYADKGSVQVVIGGDFNVRLNMKDREGERTIDILTEAGFHSSWEGVPFEERITWPPRGNFGPACFDYIFTKGLPPHTAQLLFKPAWELSDHRPVLLSIPRHD